MSSIVTTGLIDRLREIQYQPSEIDGDMNCVGCYRTKEEGCDDDCWIGNLCKEADEDQP